MLLLWIGLSILIGIATVLLPRLFISLLFSKPIAFDVLGVLDTYPVVIGAFIYYIGAGSVNEEPLFRGILWGYLHKKGWNEKWILLLQASLFWLAHINYIGRISFWFEIPLTGLILGWIVWRSCSITTSMIAHASMNAIGTLVPYIFNLHGQ